jgi:hypothetical protein
VLSVFNCRDFGNSGTFLRIDNSVSCDSEEYDAYLSLAVFGILVYVVGIPFLFYYAIRHRQHDRWEGSARFLHHGFVDEWKYYEIFDLLRKLLLTSVSQFVASPSSPSLVLYLLLVDSAALFFVTSAKPYKNPNDDFLSTFLTFIECCAFMFAFLIIVGVTDTENYDETNLFNTLLAMIFVGLFVVAPYTFIMKIEYFRDKLYTCLGKPNILVRQLWPDRHGGGGTMASLSRWSAAGRLQGEIHDLRESVSQFERQSLAAGSSLELPDVTFSGRKEKDISAAATATVTVVSPLQQGQQQWES